MPLSGPQKRRLRALAHHLDPVVLVGAGGVSEGVVAEVERALEHHELVKVKLNDASQEEVAAAREALCTATRSEAAQTVGRVLVLWRRNHQEPRLAALPGEALKRRTEAERKEQAAARARAQARAAGGKGPTRPAKGKPSKAGKPTRAGKPTKAGKPARKGSPGKR